jgi:hypothetical protein
MFASRPRSLAFLVALAVLAVPTALAQSSGVISLTVDATQSPRKLLHAHLVIPTKPGPLTLYYPKWIPGEHRPAGPVANLTGIKFEAGGELIPWQRDTLDAFTFHLDVPAGATKLDAAYDVIEPDGASATDKLLDLEWNEAVLYPAGNPAAQLIYEATLLLPDGWKYAPHSPSPPNRAIRSPSSPSRSTCSSTRLSLPANTIAPSISLRPANPSIMKSTWSPTAKPPSP